MHRLKIGINPDNIFVKDLQDKIQANGGYCLCAIFKTEDTKCMCKEFREKDTPGYCNCNLYYKY